MKRDFDLPIMLVNTHYLKIFILILVILVAGLETANSQPVSLEQSIVMALQNNRSLQMSKADIELAGEKRKEAAGNLLPKVNLSADYRYFIELPYQLMPASVFGGPPGTYKEVRFGVPHNISAGVQFSMPVVNAVAINSLKTLDHAGEIAKLQYARTEEDVILDVSSTYYNAQILLSQLAFLDTNIINTEKLEKSVLLMYEQDVAKRTDVDRVKLQLDQLIAKRSFTHARYRQVTNALEFLMGKPASDSLEVLPVGNTLTEQEYDPGEITDLKLLESRHKINQSELKGLKLSRLPVIGGYVFYGTTGFGNTGTNSFLDFYPVSSAGVQLSFPLFSGTVTNHRIKQKKIEVSKTRLQQELVADRNQMERINAGRQYQTAEELFATTISSIDLAKKIYSNTLLHNKQGVASLSDVLLADTSLREAQQNYTSSLIDLLRAELELKRVTGNLINR